MPGPRNSRAKRRVSIQKEKLKVARKVSTSSSSSTDSEPLPTPNDRDDAPIFAPQPRIASPSNGPVSSMDEFEMKRLETQFAGFPLNDPPLLPQPCIHDPGNGPRVKDLMGFLKSPFSSQPSWEVKDCMAYHHQEVMDFLSTLLPFEQAVVSILALCARILY